MNDQIIANITARAIGTNRKRATPSRKNIGTNTMQMQSSETKAGVTIWLRAVEDRLLDRLALLQMPVDVLDGHGGVVDQDADREREAAERHDVERLADRRQHDDGAEHRERDRDRDDDGRAPAAEEQQDHHAGQQRRDARPRWRRRSMAPRTNSDWSPMKPIFSASGSWSLTSTTFCLMPAMISSVEIAPFFSTIISTERLPSTWTMLVCGGLPSRTVATSRI